MSAVLAGACAWGPPSRIDDVCHIFRERGDWYEAAKETALRWRVPISVQMAMIHQESRFRSDARPPRTRILWLFPGPRPSSAYGYAQAIESTWDAYREATDRGGADRDDFEDAVDFIGWYASRAEAIAGVPRQDAYRLYLAFHEGPTGYRRGTHRGKPWLLKVAKRVGARASLYSRQLTRCREELEDRGFPLWPF